MELLLCSSGNYIITQGSLYEPGWNTPGPSNLIKYPNLAMELIRYGISSMGGAAIANAMLHDLRPFLREDLQPFFNNLMLDGSKVDRAKKAVRIECSTADPQVQDPVICIGVDGRKDETLMYEKLSTVGDGAMRQSKSTEYHLVVTDESKEHGDYMTHCSLPLKGK